MARQQAGIVRKIIIFKMQYFIDICSRSHSAIAERVCVCSSMEENERINNFQ